MTLCGSIVSPERTTPPSPYTVITDTVRARQYDARVTVCPREIWVDKTSFELNGKVTKVYNMGKYARELT